MVAEFEIGDEPSVDVQAGTQAGTEGERELHALAVDDAVALQICVVHHANGAAYDGFHVVLQGELDPHLVAQVGRAEGDAALDDTGKTDGDAIESRLLRG